MAQRGRGDQRQCGRRICDGVWHGEGVGSSIGVAAPGMGSGHHWPWLDLQNTDPWLAPLPVTHGALGAPPTGWESCVWHGHHGQPASEGMNLPQARELRLEGRDSASPGLQCRRVTSGCGKPHLDYRGSLITWQRGGTHQPAGIQAMLNGPEPKVENWEVICGGGWG